MELGAACEAALFQFERHTTPFIHYDLHPLAARAGPSQGRIPSWNERHELRGYSRVGNFLHQSISVLLPRRGEGAEWRSSRQGAELGDDGYEQCCMGQH